MNNWEITTLGEVCRRGGGHIQTGPFGSQLHASDYVSVGVPSIMPVNIGNNQIDSNEIAKIRMEDAERLSKYRVEEGDIVYSRRGDIERRAIVRKREVGWLCGTGCLRIRLGKGVVKPEFASFYLGTTTVRQWIRNNAVGITMPNLNTTILSDLPFVVPPLEQQQSIAGVLSAIESKIELNNRINAELEAMAKTLYDYWFVQFDFPDENGHPYKSSGGKMVWNNELKREIPEGWETGKLSDIANITMGQSPPGDSYNESGSGTVFYQGCTDFGARFPTVRLYTTSPTRFAKPGDILLSVRAPVGTLNIANEACCIGRGLAAMNSKNDATAYLFGVMQNLRQIFDRRNVDGTTFGSITKDDLFSLTVLKPTSEVLRKYEEIVIPGFEKQNSLEAESRTLADLRDWLLPMLMNGQVKVNEKESERL